MVKPIAPIWVVAFVLSAAGGVVCQSVGQSLPDSPSVQAALDTTHRFAGFAEEERSALTLSAMSARPGGMLGGGFAVPEKAFGQEKQPDTVFRKYFFPPSRKRSGYPSGSGTLMGRGTHAAVRIFVARDESGKARVNTSYFLRTLTSVAADTASRPYWRRSMTEPISDFGSTLGNDAGMNVLHEFAPNLQQVMKSHAPKFVSKIAARIGRR